MKTFWRVESVKSVRGHEEAEVALQRGVWFKKNPEFEAQMADESYDGDLADEFLDLAGPAEDADWTDLGDKLNLRIFLEELPVSPGDTLVLTLEPTS